MKIKIEIDRVLPDMFVAFYSGFIEEEGYGSQRYFREHPQLSVELLDALLEKRVSIIGVDFADGAECLRLKELQREFPEYSDKLEKIISRFVDLAVPFVEGLVYDVRMAGNFSLKKLVAILSDESYENLDINEGMKAVYSWRDIDKEIDTDEEKTIEELKKYCGLDAYGLVIVYRWLREIDM